MRLRIGIFLLTFLLTFFSPTEIFAQEKDFKTFINREYAVTDTGTTTVEQKFTIENLKPDIFLKQYRLTFTDPKATQIQVMYDGKLLTPEIGVTEGKTTVHIVFPDELVGQNKQRTFTISYQTSTIASVTGKVLEVHLPSIEDNQTIDEISTQLVTPASFGKATRITPQPTSIQESNNRLIHNYSQNKESVSAFFGSEQYFDVTIRYNLYNEGTAPALAQVALPPDTSFQRVQYQSLEPKPLSIKLDEDGNWIATYELAANSTLTPQLQSSVHVQLDPFTEVPVFQPQSFHLASQQFWPTNSNQFNQLVKDHPTLKDLYDYTIETLTYAEDPSSSPTRYGADKALQQPSDVVCQEFADVFVTLARTAKTPARVLTGYGYSQDPTLRPLFLEGDVLHAWADYYNEEKQMWIPVDPTWEDTTGGLDYFNQFDLNHIVFAINGKSSTIPYPGGSYKKNNENSKDVDVSIGVEPTSSKADLTFSVINKKIFTIPIPGLYILEVTNNSGYAWYNIGVQAESSNAHIQLTYDSDNYFLPFQTQELSIFAHTTDWQLHKGAASVTISIPGQEDVIKTFEITSIPSNFYWLLNERVIIGLAIGCLLITIGTGSVLVFRQGRKRPVRRKS